MSSPASSRLSTPPMSSPSKPSPSKAPHATPSPDPASSPGPAPSPGAPSPTARAPTPGASSPIPRAPTPGAPTSPPPAPKIKLNLGAATDPPSTKIKLQVPTAASTNEADPSDTSGLAAPGQDTRALRRSSVTHPEAAPAPVEKGANKRRRSTAADASAAGPTPTKAARPVSCLSCRSRKIKCVSEPDSDRCNKCIALNRECVRNAPAPPRPPKSSKRTDVDEDASTPAAARTKGKNVDKTAAEPSSFLKTARPAKASGSAKHVAPSPGKEDHEDSSRSPKGTEVEASDEQVEDDAKEPKKAKIGKRKRVVSDDEDEEEDASPKDAEVMDVDEPTGAAQAAPASQSADADIVPTKRKGKGKGVTSPTPSFSDSLTPSPPRRKPQAAKDKPFAKPVKKRPAVSGPSGAAGTPIHASSPVVGEGTPQSQRKAPAKAAPRPTSLLASTLSNLKKKPEVVPAAPVERARPGQWTDEFVLTPEQEQQYAASAVRRRQDAAERHRKSEYPLQMQAARDAYRADYVINGQRRAINVQGCMGILTTGMPSRMVRAVLNGDVRTYDKK